jgi:WS/DGAT/MGAT family acyltransferase
MSRYAYERLTHESAAILEGESSRSFAHACTTLIFESGPLGHSDGGVDFPAIRRAIEARLHRAPLYRRKLRRVPLENHPVWVDDHEFNLDYHVRHTSLPRPGGMDELRKVSARVQATRMDRSRPLWECWVLEGLAGDRFALVLKTHTVLADAGADLMQELLSPEPDPIDEEPPPFEPRPVPSTAELWRDEVVRQARLPRRAMRRFREFSSQSEDFGAELARRARAVAGLLGYSVRPLHDSPLSGHVGPHRRFDHLVLALDDAKSVRAHLGGTIHDVVLTTVAGAAARYLRQHFVNPATLDFRAAVPMSLRAGDHNEGIGEWIVELPIWEADPLKRYRRVCERTAEQNRISPALGARTLYSVAKWTSSRLLAQGVRAMSARTLVNLRVANVPGPQLPLFLSGARMVECYGKVPLGVTDGLGIAVISYDGKLCIGLNADFDLVQDLETFSEALVASFDELCEAARGHRGKLALVS